MPNFYGSVLTDMRSSLRGNANEANGKVRYRSLASAAFDAAQNDVVALALIRKDERVISGVVTTTAFGASVTMDLGTYLVGSYDPIAVGAVDTKDRFLNDTAVAAITSTAFAATLALGLGFLATVDVLLCATLEGANPASGSFGGYVLVVGD